MEHLHVIAKFTGIPRDARAAFKQLAEQALAITNDEPGVLQYDWFFNADETACAVRETYRNSDALLNHVTNAGDVFGRLVEISGGCELEMFGTPSADLVIATAELPFSMFPSLFQGKNAAYFS
jgi:quinol monooxygenase YgiN